VFGKFSAIEIDGKPYFPATKAATILSYGKPDDAVRRHCPHPVKRGVGVQTGEKADGTPAMQTVEKTFIPEGDQYRLIVRSNLPANKSSVCWIC
jgi:prophage antirepressor-like protein